ncbi:MAG: prepilin-type N-terminal cleavage/methylation domain-containing protein [Armatimonadetes bacterium]|nr:prepilin-type N-terminal cleavage/methylation domain-containing protein [Armatimonadota bacterium]
MKPIRKAFTLIELLVVIAIIAILAAILFPVFAQAKQAAKNTQSISGMKQIGLGLYMYLNDNEDKFPLIRIRDGRNWKHVIYPYIKNDAIFKDSVNPASKFFDDGAFTNQWNLGNIPQPKMPRGYFYYRAFHKTGAWQAAAGDTTVSDYSVSQINEPSRALIISENKDLYPDYGPWMEYLWKGQNGWTQPNWGGGKLDDRQMVVIFADTHAKMTPLIATCTAAAGSENMWQYDPTNLHFTINGKDENLTWMDTFCTTYRQKRP